MKRLQIPQKCVYENFTYTKKVYVHEITDVNLSNIYFLKNAKKTCKANKRDLNRDWKIDVFIVIVKSTLRRSVQKSHHISLCSKLEKDQEKLNLLQNLQTMLLLM